MKENENNMSGAELGELIVRVRADDSAAFETLLSRYEPMIGNTVRRYAPQGQEDDARQEALAGFYRAVLTFDTTQPCVEFGLYAKICVTRALISHAREAQRRARQTAGAVEYEDYVRYHADTVSDPAQQIIDEENISSLRRLIRENLSAFENRVWDMYTAGVPAATIACELGRSERSINNALYRIRRKLRGLLDSSPRPM